MEIQRIYTGTVQALKKKLEYVYSQISYLHESCSDEDR